MGLLNPLNPLLNSIIVYIILVLLLIYSKPSVIYDKKTKKFKQFGMQKGKSILSLPILAILIAIITYVIFLHFEKSTVIMNSYYNLMNK